MQELIEKRLVIVQQKKRNGFTIKPFEVKKFFVNEKYVNLKLAKSGKIIRLKTSSIQKMWVDGAEILSRDSFIESDNGGSYIENLQSTIVPETYEVEYEYED